MEKFLAALILCLSLTGCFYQKDNIDAMAGSSLDLTIPLDVAVPTTNPQRFAVRGKFIQIDPGSTGQANLRINSVSDTPRLAYPGQQFSPGDFTDLYFDYLAQPGKFLHVLYGDSPDILSAGIRTTNDAAVTPEFYEATLNAFAIVNIITAANNPRGIKLSSGVLGTVVASLAGNPAESSARLYYVDSGGGLIYLGVARASTAGGTQDENAFNIQATFIPPNVNVLWVLNTSGTPTLTRGSIHLNFQTL